MDLSRIVKRVGKRFIECVTILTITCAVQNETIAQVSLKYWMSYGTSIRLKSGNSLNFSLQDGFESDFSKSYHQYRASYTFEIAKPLDLQAYLVRTYSGETDELELTNRYGLSFSLLLLKISKFRLDWSSDFEGHSKNEKRYRQRSIHSLDMRVGKYSLGRNVKLAFLTGSSIYYNLGGRPISQYREDGEYIGERKPDGFHRARVYAGMAVSIGSIQISPSFMIQREFNLPGLEGNQINTTDFNSGKIRNKFNNYNVISMRIRYIIRSKNIGEESDDLDRIEN